MIGTTICPGCLGAKSKKAKLCAGCRRRAMDAGVDVVLERINAKQIAAFHAIADNIDRLRGEREGTTKARVKAELGIESIKVLSYERAGDVLTALKDERSELLAAR